MAQRHALVAATLVTALLPAQTDAPAPAAKLDLRVLYAGEPDHERTADWRRFLDGAVREVGVADVARLSRADTTGFDIVIVDTPPPFDDAGKFKGRKVAELPGDWDRATVALGYGAGMILRNREIKLDWL